MFVITRKKKNLGLVDEIKTVASAIIGSRSIKPVQVLYRKGRFGSRLILEGSYSDWLRYEAKIKKHSMFTVG